MLFRSTDSSAVVADGKVCLGSHYLDFYCFNQENGKVIWKEKLGGPSAALANNILVVPNALAGESPGSILVAFSGKGIQAAVPTGLRLSLDNRNLQIVLGLILALFIGAVSYKLLKFRQITVKQLLIFGAVPLVLLIAVLFVYRQYTSLQWSGSQTQLINEGKIDPATGSFIENDGSPKHVQYQGKRYFLDGGGCTGSQSRYSVQVKRVNGAVSADGSDGNTMYAIGSKDNPEYIASAKDNNMKKDCWRRE